MFESLYIHVPFCHLKCDYCAFYSLGYTTETHERQYLDKLEEDCRQLHGQCAPLKSIFIGGGTPTALSHRGLERLLAMVNRHFTKAPDCEWTSEANPESLDHEHIQAMVHAGLTRISIGVQSFVPEERAVIGRRGALDSLPEAVAELQSEGLSNINLDLIYMIPGQTPDSFRYSLQQALALKPQHISAYALTLEDKTPLAKHFKELDDQDFLQFWDTADQILNQKGIFRYEISNFARKGYECRHNDDVWHGTTYLGLGPAATSFDGRDRFTQPRSLQQWLRNDPPDLDQLPPDSRACEILAFGMRTLKGWNFNHFQQVTGKNPMELRGDELRKLHRKGLILLTDHDAKPTTQGLLFNDDVLMELI